MIIYPAIDLRDGRCVRLRQGDPNAETVYADDPIRVARDFQSEGAEALHIVDLDGAFEGEPIHLEVVRDIVGATGLPIQFGGGLRSMERLEAAFAAGVTSCIIGTRAMEEQFLTAACERWPGRIKVGLDCRDGKLAWQGWQSDSGVPLETALSFLKRLGLTEVIYTDISRDGMLSGPDLDGLRQVLASGLKAIASGGIKTKADVADVATLAPLGLSGAIIGKALYTGNITLPDALAAAASNSAPTAEAEKA